MAAPTKEGFLDKLGGRVFRRWQRRFFVLQNDCIEYYSSETKKTLSGRIELIDAKVEAGPIDGERFTFFVRPTQASKHDGKLKVYQLASDSDRDRVNWIILIRNACRAGKSNPKLDRFKKLREASEAKKASTSSAVLPSSQSHSQLDAGSRRGTSATPRSSFVGRASVHDKRRHSTNVGVTSTANALKGLHAAAMRPRRSSALELSDSDTESTGSTAPLRSAGPMITSGSLPKSISHLRGPIVTPPRASKPSDPAGRSAASTPAGRDTPTHLTPDKPQRMAGTSPSSDATGVDSTTHGHSPSVSVSSRGGSPISMAMDSASALPRTLTDMSMDSVTSFRSDPLVPNGILKAGYVRMHPRVVPHEATLEDVMNRFVKDRGTFVLRFAVVHADSSSLCIYTYEADAQFGPSAAEMQQQILNKRSSALGDLPVAANSRLRRYSVNTRAAASGASTPLDGGLTTEDAKKMLSAKERAALQVAFVAGDFCYAAQDETDRKEWVAVLTGLKQGWRPAAILRSLARVRTQMSDEVEGAPGKFKLRTVTIEQNPAVRARLDKPFRWNNEVLPRKDSHWYTLTKFSLLNYAVGQLRSRMTAGLEQPDEAHKGLVAAQSYLTVHGERGWRSRNASLRFVMLRDRHLLIFGGRVSQSDGPEDSLDLSTAKLTRHPDEPNLFSVTLDYRDDALAAKEANHKFAVVPRGSISWAGTDVTEAAEALFLEQTEAAKRTAAAKMASAASQAANSRASPISGDSGRSESSIVLDDPVYQAATFVFEAGLECEATEWCNLIQAAIDDDLHGAMLKHVESRNMLRSRSDLHAKTGTGHPQRPSYYRNLTSMPVGQGMREIMAEHSKKLSMGMLPGGMTDTDTDASEDDASGRGDRSSSELLGILPPKRELNSSDLVASAAAAALLHDSDDSSDDEHADDEQDEAKAEDDHADEGQQEQQMALPEMDSDSDDEQPPPPPPPLPPSETLLSSDDEASSGLSTDDDERLDSVPTTPSLHLRAQSEHTSHTSSDSAGPDFAALQEQYLRNQIPRSRSSTGFASASSTLRRSTSQPAHAHRPSFVMPKVPRGKSQSLHTPPSQQHTLEPFAVPSRVRSFTQLQAEKKWAAAGEPMRRMGRRGSVSPSLMSGLARKAVAQSKRAKTPSPPVVRRSIVIPEEEEVDVVEEVEESAPQPTKDAPQPATQAELFEMPPDTLARRVLASKSSGSAEQVKEAVAVLATRLSHNPDIRSELVAAPERMASCLLDVLHEPPAEEGGETASHAAVLLRHLTFHADSTEVLSNDAERVVSTVLHQLMWQGSGDEAAHATGDLLTSMRNAAVLPKCRAALVRSRNADSLPKPVDPALESVVTSEFVDANDWCGIDVILRALQLHEADAHVQLAGIQALNVLFDDNPWPDNVTPGGLKLQPHAHSENLAWAIMKRGGALVLRACITTHATDSRLVAAAKHLEKRLTNS